MIRKTPFKIAAVTRPRSPCPTSVSVTITLGRPVRRWGLVLLATLVAWLGWRWWQRYDYANLPPSATGPWVAFGDSLTEGFGASPGHDYPSVLSQKLGMKIVNLGRSGDSTEDGLQRLEDVARLNPRVVLLCLGGNDGLQGRSRERMIINLSAMLDRLQAGGSFVVLIGVRSASLRDKNEKYFRKLAREKQVMYVPNILQGIFPKPIYMADALHPNDEGYRLIAERLEQHLRPLRPKLGPL
jgi:acyl-CoA thioesterase I